MRREVRPATLFVALLLVGLPVAGQTEEGPKFGYEAYTDSEGRSESYWVQRMSEARSRVHALEAEVERLDAAVGALRLQWTSVDDPNQQILVKDAWDDAIVRGERARDELRKAREAIDAAEVDARRAGALPGWLRQRSEDAEPPRAEPLTAVTFRVDIEELADQNARSDREIYGEAEERPTAKDHADE